MPVTKKKPVQVVDMQNDVVGYLQLSEEDFGYLTTYSYLLIDRFATGEATHAERQSTLIRLYAGMQRLLDFYYEGGGSLLWRTLEAVNAYRPQAKKEVRKLSPEQIELLTKATVMIDEMLSNSSVWENAQAYKYGEDKCIKDSNQTEYVLITVH